MKSLSALYLYWLVVVPFVLVKGHNISVDCNSKIRRVTHCANGSLYGITETTPRDYKNLVDPLHPFVMRNPARGGNGNQHPYGDAIKVARRLSETPGALVSVDLPDMLPGWPYKWPGMQSWLNQVRSFINDKKQSGLKNWYGLEIWNEPDGTWQNSNGSFEEMWKQTYQAIRQADPGEKIIGPCYSWYTDDKLRNFLKYAKANNCLPDIISWHELSGIAGVSSHLRSYRQIEKSLGIPELPISINEYCDAKHELEGQPGSSARFIGKFERYKVDTAMITWWFVPHPGRLGSLLATDTAKGAGWYFYKWYGDMTGDMVNVTPPKDDSDLVDGAACVDASNKYISFIFGGPNDGTINANIKNIPSFIGSTANVKVEKVDWSNKDAPSNGPNTISDTKMNISNGQLNIRVPNTNGSSGYRILITAADGSSNPAPPQTGNNNGNNNQPQPQPQPQQPQSSTIKSGEKYYLINRSSGKALSVQNDSTSNAANVCQWTQGQSSSQQWTITSVDGGYKLINVNSGKALDVNEKSTKDGGNVIIWTDNGGYNQLWTINDLGDGYFTLENYNSGKLLDVDNGSMSDGGNVLQWGSNGGLNQQWKIVSVGGTTQPKTTTQPAAQPTSASTGDCAAAILKQGYKCCPKGCTVEYTDGDGNWGVHNGEWCGCGAPSNTPATCKSTFTSQGYKCCSANNCLIYFTDESGNWGIENQEWCGIPDSCN